MSRTHKPVSPRIQMIKANVEHPGIYASVNLNGFSLASELQPDNHCAVLLGYRVPHIPEVWFGVGYRDGEAYWLGPRGLDPHYERLNDDQVVMWKPVEWPFCFDPGRKDTSDYLQYRYVLGEAPWATEELAKAEWERNRAACLAVPEPLSVPDVQARIREAGGEVNDNGAVGFRSVEHFVAAAVLCGESPNPGEVPTQKEPRPTADAIVWPKQRHVGRRDDMSNTGLLQVSLDSDNDVCVSVSGGEGDRWQSASVEFCNGGGGGGRSTRTRHALIALMVAIEADNSESPHKAFPPTTQAPQRTS